MVSHMNDLIRRLSEGEHPVEVSIRPQKTIEGFRSALDRGYVHIRFTTTRGGTEVGFNVDKSRSDFTQADFENTGGCIKLCGNLTLDYEKVRCVAEIDLATLIGTGHLELLDEPA